MERSVALHICPLEPTKKNLVLVVHTVELGPVLDKTNTKEHKDHYAKGFPLLTSIHVRRDDLRMNDSVAYSAGRFVNNLFPGIPLPRFRYEPRDRRKSSETNLYLTLKATNHFMKSFFHRLVNAGITPRPTSQQIRTVSFLNTITLLVVLLIAFNTIFTVIMMPLTSAGKTLFAVSAAHALLIAMIIPINLRKRYLFARIYFGFVAGSFMCIYALVMGSETRWTFFSPIIIFILFYVFPGEEKKWMYGTIAYCAVSFITCELWFVNHQALYNFPPAIISSFKYINSTGFLFCAVGIGMVGYNAINGAEKKLAAEHLRSENLLLNILPDPIAKRLKNNPGIIAERYENVSILFADIADFTKLSSKISPDELVQLLNEIFSKFDELADEFRLEKIKTIGDAYMVVAGLPDKRTDHAESIAEMGIAMLHAMAAFNDTHEYQLNLRIGICSGPVVAGVIGKRKFSYDLWGDSVNAASRMESHGVPGEIQVTESTYQLLETKYQFDSRGMIEVKGKGLMKAYLLKKR